MLPLFLPVSLGAYVRVPDPNLKSFGLRAAYHIDLRNPRLDLYFLYRFDLGFLRNNLLIEYGDEAQDRYYYDFRVGIRYLTGLYIALALETDFKFQGINFGVSIKIN
jgi:hypothetical protein